MKRKRKQFSSETSSDAHKRLKLQSQHPQPQSSACYQHPVLGLYYPNICTLGQLLRESLPSTSRVRRKKLNQFDVDFPQHSGFLNTIVVGFNKRPSNQAQEARRVELVTFTQTQRLARGNSLEKYSCDLSEILDFAIWTLFRQDAAASRTPSNLLCMGLLRANSLNKNERHEHPMQLPGIVERKRNPNVQALRQAPWTDVANLLGKDAEKLMLNLFLDCALFQQLSSGNNNLCQLTGEPLPRVAPYRNPQSSRLKVDPTARSLAQRKRSASITLARHRMFYARASTNGKGYVQLGMKHVHILNRCSDPANTAQELRVMQYVFPGQFGLHSAFYPKQYPNGTGTTPKDYTLREPEVIPLDPREACKVPRRLRGAAQRLVCKLRRNHHRCSYTQLVRYYCPILSTSCQHLTISSADSQDSTLWCDSFATQIAPKSTNSVFRDESDSSYTTSLMPHATPPCQVTAFCQAVIYHLLPRNAFGEGINGEQNWSNILQSIKQFIEMRRFEYPTLEDICNGLKINCVDWLRPPSMRSSDKVSASDRSKRLDIFHELIYYVFDSLIIPLIRSNFYVTETGAHRNRLFYFRHDVWKKLVEPNLAVLTLSMYEHLNARQLKHHYSSSLLGSGQMRLLPKAHGVRPIMNLKRKVTRLVGGQVMPGSSINSDLAPLFSILNFEKQRQPEKLSSAMFSVSDIHGRLRSFKARLTIGQEPLYFVKVDIRSCFDSIPQQGLLSLVTAFILEKEYCVPTHVEMKKAITSNGGRPGYAIRKYVKRAISAETNSCLSVPVAAELAHNKHQHVFVGTDTEQRLRLLQIRELLKDHIHNNVVRIGHKHFKQIQGIPQGSVLSSFLCNLFYGEFERQELSFIDPQSTLLLRLIDDFLLITTSEAQARTFVHAMSLGNTKYGISINAEKSLVNFEVSVHGHKVPRLHGHGEFPYCGLMIDTRSLEIRKGRQSTDAYVENGLSIVRSGKVGSTLQSKILSALKRQMYGVLLDGSLNTRSRVMSSIFECFVESGMKMHRYLRSLSSCRRPHPTWQVDLCHQLIVTGNKMLCRARSYEAKPVSWAQMSWLASAALSQVLVRKQAEYEPVLRWLDSIQQTASRAMNMTRHELDYIVQDGMKNFVDHKY